MQNCIFVCIFNNENYIRMFFLLLESIISYGNIGDDTHILIYTSTIFSNFIKQNENYKKNNDKIFFEINDTYNNIDTACKSRLDLFDLKSIEKYNKILYLDIDIIIKDDIHKVFNAVKHDIIYALEEGEIDAENGYWWGKTLFGDEIHHYPNKTAFTSGILLFNNCDKIKELFKRIHETMVTKPNAPGGDQPYIVYNAFKYRLYDNQTLKKHVVNNDYNFRGDKVIYHFAGGVGEYGHKLVKMNAFLNGLKSFYPK